MRIFCGLFIMVLFSVAANAQPAHLPYVETVATAKAAGIFDKLATDYKSAIDLSDSSKAVFKSAEDRDRVSVAYTKLLRELGNYLDSHNFKWEQPTRCWNRIYFNKDGTIEYYVIDFKTEISEEKLAKYKELFTAFAATHKIGLTAAEGFAQCSPVVFKDKAAKENK